MFLIAKEKQVSCLHRISVWPRFRLFVVSAAELLHILLTYADSEAFSMVWDLFVAEPLSKRSVLLRFCGLLSYVKLGSVDPTRQTPVPLRLVNLGRLSGHQLERCTESQRDAGTACGGIELTSVGAALNQCGKEVAATANQTLSLVQKGVRPFQYVSRHVVDTERTA